MKKGSRQGEATGEVFTRPEVVSYMLDGVRRCGKFKTLTGLRVLEPSCGDGAFVIPLVESWLAEKPDFHSALADVFLVACDISASNIEKLREILMKRLVGAGCTDSRADELLSKWLICDDFLLHDFHAEFDVVIGNPPYIRFDDIPAAKQREYRARFVSFAERCDIYVPFFEKSLALLSDEGVFSFICTNRFTKSSYGKQLRRLIADNYHVALYLNMEHAQPFVEEVTAYPAIYIIDRRQNQETRSATIDDAGALTLDQVRLGKPKSKLSVFERWYKGEAPWISTNCREREMADKIAKTFPTIPKSAEGTEIGIGVASGADDIYINAQRTTSIESCCLLPLVASEDIRDGCISWDGRYLLNPYDDDDDTRMRDLERYPLAAAYFDSHAQKLKARYCARKRPHDWYRTLDRVKYALLRSPKILIPDIQMGGNVALDECGTYYPHHNVYWITSAQWNLKALCALLRSSFVTSQVRNVSVQMRGGSIRYQAQNLRNVHIPAWSSLNSNEIEKLVCAYESNDASQLNRVVDAVVRDSAARQPASPYQADLFG
ncbi:MAG: Eco57I restriction-modification methylase domain-containing protein [Kiritimatiellia bacterium]